MIFKLIHFYDFGEKIYIHLCRDVNLHAINRLLGCERVYRPLGNVADTPFHIQKDEIAINMIKETFVSEYKH